MKKLCKWICSFMLCMSLAACSSASKVDDAAVQAFIDAVAKMAELNSASYEVKVGANVNNQDIDANIHGDILNTDDTQQFSLVADLTSQGQTMEKFAEMYITDDASYFNFMGVKQKSVIEPEIKDNISKVETGNETMHIDMLKPYLKAASMDGNTITLELDMEKAMEMDQAQETKDKVSFGDFIIKVELTDGFISNLHFDCVMTDKSTSNELTMNGDMTLTDINNIESIEFPDFSDYVEDAFE